MRRDVDRYAQRCLGSLGGRQARLRPVVSFLPVHADNEQFAKRRGRPPWRRDLSLNALTRRR